MKPQIKDGIFVHQHPKIKNYFFILVVGTHEEEDPDHVWEHVSVTLKKKEGKKEKPVNRSPTWEEMCFIKDLLWGEDEEVIQYHPAKSDYVNFHDHCLHLWKNKKGG
jgi:hypothetical protein